MTVWVLCSYDWQICPPVGLIFYLSDISAFPCVYTLTTKKLHKITDVLRMKQLPEGCDCHSPDKYVA